MHKQDFTQDFLEGGSGGENCSAYTVNWLRASMLTKGGSGDMPP